jgi:hypothetical protein
MGYVSSTGCFSNGNNSQSRWGPQTKSLKQKCSVGLD